MTTICAGTLGPAARNDTLLGETLTPPEIGAGDGVTGAAEGAAVGLADAGAVGVAAGAVGAGTGVEVGAAVGTGFPEGAVPGAGGAGVGVAATIVPTVPTAGMLGALAEPPPPQATSKTAQMLLKLRGKNRNA